MCYLWVEIDMVRTWYMKPSMFLFYYAIQIFMAIVKNEKSRLYISYFLFNLFSFILFLELGLELEWQDHAVTQQVTSDDTVTGHMIHRRT